MIKKIAHALFPPKRFGSATKVAYSCYVDASPKYEWQALVMCASLIENANIISSDIKVHTHKDVSRDFVTAVKAMGVQVIETAEFDSKWPHCNKIMQADASNFEAYDVVAFCDCDQVFLAPVDANLGDADVAGRPVDRPNPPYDLLLKLFNDYELKLPGVVAVGVPLQHNEMTLSTNFNGGLYLISTAQLSRLGRRWKKYAQILAAELPDYMASYSVHIDQISFSMAVSSLGLKSKLLENTHNVPTHFEPSSIWNPPENPVSLHYHHLQDHLGRLVMSSDARLWPAIERSNKFVVRTVGDRLRTEQTFQRVFSRWQEAIAPSDPQRISATIEFFRNPRYLRHTARRLEHLASLNLNLRKKTVLELGAGIGEHSQFFLDRGCQVFSVEPRPENVAVIRHRHSEPSEHLNAGHHTVLQATAEDAFQILENAKFEILYNYGLLYHLADPLGFLRKSAEFCEGIYLLETAVSDLAATPSKYSEDTRDVTNSVTDDISLASRADIFNTLRQFFPYVYIPRRQPAHEQFLNDWTLRPEASPGRHRAVFVASVSELDNPTLSSELLDYHDQ